ncbi:ABC transporter substrate-binding protein, partial [Paenirhodobacter enshiensis]|uniref:ABC transporter substrate-binding protein n=1 Tax=Paenirhodobacter enshiensis TaxID=1105367 RepID=UPI003FA1DB00
ANVLAFPNNVDIAGGNVFVLGSTSPNTASRLASYAAAQGKDRIFVLSDQTTAGTIGARAITAALGRSGAALAGQASYPFSQDGLNSAMPEIAQQINASGANALFLTADTAGALPLLAQLLPQNGIDPQATKFLGLTRWDVPNATLALPGLQGGWFALPDPSMNDRFQSRYKAAYGSAPHPIAGLAYDGIAAIGALVKSGRSDPFSAKALTQSSGFVGVSGVFRLLPDGTNQRALAVAEVRNGTLAIVDPAPKSFSGAGF